MGTNYYTRINCCDKCGRYDEIHIGKKSFGWKFLFAPNYEHNISTFQEWKTFLADKKIWDEYRRNVPMDEFLEMIMSSYTAKKNYDLQTYYVDFPCKYGTRWADHERIDPEGYRFSTTENFS